MKFNKDVWNAIVNLMDDEIREQVHNHMAPCTEEEFLFGYLALDGDFRNVLESEFSIDLENGSYIVEDAEAGNAILFANTYEQALEAIDAYENEDKEEGIFTPGFYAIRHNGKVEVIRD